MYPNLNEERFDFDYYQQTHLPLVTQLYKPHGLESIDLDIALTKSGKNAAPYLAIAYLTFTDQPSFLNAIKASGKEVGADIINFTSIEPIIQLSEAITC